MFINKDIHRRDKKKIVKISWDNHGATLKRIDGFVKVQEAARLVDAVCDWKVLSEE